MERWKKGRFDNKKPEDLESEFYHLMWIIRIQLRLSKAVTSWIWISRTNNYLTDIKLAKPHYPLTQCQREKFRGLTNISYLSLRNFSTVTMVKTSINNVNTKCAADMYTNFLL